MSHQEPVPPEQNQGQPQADSVEARVPDPEVLPKAKRRPFTARHRLRILDEADRCSERGQRGETWRNTVSGIAKGRPSAT